MHNWLSRMALPLVMLGLGAHSLQAAEYVVKFNVDSSQALNAPEIAGFPILDRHQTGLLAKINIPDQGNQFVAKSLEAIINNPSVAYVVPNVKFKAFGTPNDPKYGQQWALNTVKAPDAWTVNSGAREVVVAVIDTGVDWQHEDLAANIYENPGEIAGNGVDDDGNGFVDDVRGWDFRDNDADPMDLTSAQNPGHGTHCAGIVGAAFNNGVGIAGMAPGISLMPVRFLGADGSGDLLTAAKAIDYAVDNGADVISASWGASVSKDQVTPILEAIERANTAGIPFVVAAANDGKNNDSTEVYPANAPSTNVISVAASNSSDGKPSWSNYGFDKVHVASPGEGIYSTLPSRKYGNLSGTSMATPLVAGLVGLLRSQAGDAGIAVTPWELRAILQSSGQKVAIETACECRVDAFAALNHLGAETLTVVPAALTVKPGESASFAGWGGVAPYSLTSSDPAIASIDAQGTLTAHAEGQVVLTIQDSAGATKQSKAIRIANPPQGGGGGGECPVQDPNLCSILCQLDPSLPWCS